ncbi:MAG: M24 family metallopeptidase [Acidaminococcaceae bacterium]
MNRLDRLRHFLQERCLSGIFIKGLSSIRYFTGFSGDDSLLFIDNRQAVIVTDSRYTLQAVSQAPDCFVLEHTDGLWEAIKKINFSGRLFGFDGDSFSYQDYQLLSSQLGDSILSSFSLVSLRSIKDEMEIELIKKAVAISDKAFEFMLDNLHEGMREIEAAALLEYEMRRLGSEGVSFPTIVASGTRSALPHGIASSKVIEKGDFVTFDFGATYCGYHSDITRTLVVGKASSWQQKIYELVCEAQMLGIKNAKAGMTGAELDALVRSYITSRGYGQYFGHGLGHGVGLDIHELPVASRRGKEKLAANMVVTVEPGIYIPGKGGVRIEDVIVITPDGCNVLTNASKILFEIN